MTNILNNSKTAVDGHLILIDPVKAVAKARKLSKECFLKPSIHKVSEYVK